MTDEIKEAEQENQEIVEETENAEEAVQEEAVEETNETEAEKLKLALDNLNNQYLRLAADFENYRKRQAQEREALLKYGAEECMKKVLEVVDNFDRALTMVDKIEDLDKRKHSKY